MRARIRRELLKGTSIAGIALTAGILIGQHSEKEAPAPQVCGYSTSAEGSTFNEMVHEAAQQAGVRVTENDVVAIGQSAVAYYGHLMNTPAHAAELKPGVRLGLCWGIGHPGESAQINFSGPAFGGDLPALPPSAAPSSPQ